MTNEDLLAAWDAGHSVDVCSMGGLSDDYEQAIYQVGMEMLRAMLAHPVDYAALARMDSAALRESNRAYTDQIVAVPAVKEALDREGITGAQFGAAENIAHVFARHGYAGAQATIPAGRRITLVNVRAGSRP